MSETKKRKTVEEEKSAATPRFPLKKEEALALYKNTKPWVSYDGSDQKTLPKAEVYRLAAKFPEALEPSEQHWDYIDEKLLSKETCKDPRLLLKQLMHRSRWDLVIKFVNIFDDFDYSIPFVLTGNEVHDFPGSNPTPMMRCAQQKALGIMHVILMEAGSIKDASTVLTPDVLEMAAVVLKPEMVIYILQHPQFKKLSEDEIFTIVLKVMEMPYINEDLIRSVMALLIYGNCTREGMKRHWKSLREAPVWNPPSGDEVKSLAEIIEEDPEVLERQEYLDEERDRMATSYNNYVEQIGQFGVWAGRLEHYLNRFARNSKEFTHFFCHQFVSLPESME